ncbi:MAG TPA: hypothetical protein VIE43_03435 [Thermoanaerobaculia bacterium]|nr:hypothetical protein [Thermoanaerobaculia bacterium]
MRLRRAGRARNIVLLCAALLCLPVLAVQTAHAAEPPRSEITLALKDYLDLVEKGDAAEKEQRQRQASREAPVAEVTSQRVRVVLGDKDVAEVTADYEVLVEGVPRGPVVLPVTGVPREATVTPAGAGLSAGTKAGEWLLVAPAPGRYAVRVAGPVPLSSGGVSRLSLAPAAAPVALTEVELPADLAWTAPGTVVVEDQVAGARRTVRLTSNRGEAQTLEVRRKVDGGDAEKLLAQSVVLTLVQLRPDGPRRHDVVIYEVSRGGLGSFTVDLPPGLTVETVGTDEGEMAPAIEGRRLTVQRRQQLRGVGYLVLSSTPAVSTAGGADLSLDPVTPEGNPQSVRARYVALASSVAADAHPLPEAAWSRVDLDDLPPTLREALGGVDLAAAWRLTGTAPATAPAGLRMAVASLPAAPALPALASYRETTTLITLDGTLLHRDRIVVRPAAIGTALEMTLAPGATLWSAQVDGVAVRPLERGGGRISVPLGFDTGKDARVEVVSVQEKAIPKGRSELALDVPRLAIPVQQHRWRLLLPDGAQYRFLAGDLKPAKAAITFRGGSPRVERDDGRISTGATISQSELEKIPTTRDPWAVLQSTPGVLTDRLNVGGNESGQQAGYAGPGAKAVNAPKPAAPPPASAPVYYDFDAFEELKKGLVGGVKPLPVAIPETGKLLLLTGVLPPEKIGVEIEVKGNKEKRGWF